MRTRAGAVDVEARQVEAREGEVLGAEHDRQDEIAEDVGIDGIMNSQTMVTPWSVNMRL